MHGIQSQGGMSLSTYYLEYGILRDCTVVAVTVVRTRPRSIPLAMITMRKSTHGFPFLSYMSMGLCLAALRAAGAPLKKSCLWEVWIFSGTMMCNWVRTLFKTDFPKTLGFCDLYP